MNNIVTVFSRNDSVAILFMVRMIAFFALFFFISSCRDAVNKEPVTSPWFDSIISKAEHIYDAGNKTGALSLVIAAHAGAKNLTTGDEMNYFTYISGIYRKDLNDNDRYISCADSMIALLEKNNEAEEFSGRLVQAYNMRADALFSKGLYNDSYDYYYKAKALAKENADSCSLSKYSYSLGMVLYKQQHFSEAAYYFKESYHEAEACKNNFLFFYHRQELLDNIGLCYNRAQKYDSALLYYEKTLAYIDSNYMRFDKKEYVYVTAKAVVYGNIGDVFIALNNYDTAKALLKKSIAINLQKGYTNQDALVDQVKLANLYQKDDNDIAALKDLLLRIHAELDSIPDKDVEISWNKLMWQYYDQQHDPVKADQYIRAYMQMNDSVVARNKLLMSSDVEERIKSLERQNHINELSKKNRQDKVLLVVAVIILILSLIIIGQILRNAFRSRQNVNALTLLNATIIEQKEQLQLALTELEAKDKDKTRILRSVAHDVMNPIAAIMSLSDILISESENFSEEHVEIFELIKEACNNSLGLSKDILQAAATVDPAHVAKEWLDINLLVYNSVKLLNFKAVSKKQHIIIKSGRKNIQAYVNKKKIWRLVNNLIVNAIKFSYENSEIEIYVEETAGNIHIAVKDYGIGIPEKNKPYIFDMFTEAKIPGTSGEAPHGLGLSISLQIAKSHNGKIWFESEEGKGSVFHLSIPANADKKNNYLLN
jgi:signal transduction histidine kinase